MASRLTDLICKKTNCTCSTLFLLICKKQICTCSTLFLSFPCRCFAGPTTLFCTTKMSNFLVTHVFYGGIVVCAYPIFCFLAVFMFAFIFHCRSFSPCWPLAFLIYSPPLWISMFLFLRDLFSITRSSSFSVIHVSVNIKNNAEKDTTLSGHVISFEIKPWVAFGLPYLLIELFYLGMPVMRTLARARYVTLGSFIFQGGRDRQFNAIQWCFRAMIRAPRP